jgi:hypothetical protein
MMHMINVFSSPATQEKDHAKNSDTTSITDSKEKDHATNTSDTEQVTTEDGGDDDSTDHRDESSKVDITTTKRSPRPKATMHATLIDNSNEDDKKADTEEDHASPYADLVGLLRNISLKSDESDTKLRERHAQLVDLLWNAALRSSTTAAPSAEQLAQLKTPSSTTIYPSTHIPSSPSLKHSLASPRSPLTSHSIAV